MSVTCCQTAPLIHGPRPAGRHNGRAVTSGAAMLLQFSAPGAVALVARPIGGVPSGLG